MFIAGQVAGGPYGDAGPFEIYYELRHSAMTLGRFFLCAGQSDHEMRSMCIGRPDLAAVQDPTSCIAPRSSADRCEVGARARLAHANAKIALTATNPRQEALLLRLGAIAQQHWCALSIRNPVCRHRGTGGQ